TYIEQQSQLELFLLIALHDNTYGRLGGNDRMISSCNGKCATQVSCDSSCG
ncbi:unnamed protein product, partial [Musa hybrid cultivar]